jgi:hypothetical protein
VVDFDTTCMKYRIRLQKERGVRFLYSFKMTVIDKSDLTLYQ